MNHRNTESHTQIRPKKPIYFYLFCALVTLFSARPLIAETQLPTIGNTSSSLISIDGEKALGKAWLRALRRQVPVYSNPVVETYFSNLVYQLAPNSEVLDREFSLILINSPNLNAFAAPGSIIGANAGLFLHAASEQEFASVVAHELAHLSQRHYARRLEKQKLSAVINLAGLLASIAASAAGTDAAIATLASTQALSADQQLRFSRQNEQEADRIGIETLYQSGFDPRAMPILFERMMRKNRLQGEQIPEYLSTHPLSESRVSDTKNRAALFEPKNYRDSLHYHIARNIIYTDFSETRAKAASHFQSIIDRKSSLELPAVKFGLAYALIEIETDRSIDILRKIIKEHPDLIPAHIYLAQALHKAGIESDAFDLLESLLERNPDNYPISHMLAMLYLESNKIKESEALLKQLARLQPENPDIWYNLAELNGLAGNISSLHQSRAEYFFLSNRMDEAIKQLKLAKKKSTSGQQRALIDKRISELYEYKRNPLI